MSRFCVWVLPLFRVRFRSLYVYLILLLSLSILIQGYVIDMTRSVALGAFFCMILIGCNGGKGEMSKQDFLLAGGGRGWDAIAPMDWTARKYMAQQPPMDGVLVNALADPFTVDASWVKPESSGERNEISARLAEWWDGTQGQPAKEMDDEVVASQFSVVVAARVLQARIETLEGREAEGFAIAVETLKIAKEAMTTAPESYASEVVPSILIAAEAVSTLSRSGKINEASLKSGLEELNVDLVGGLASKLSRVYFKRDLPQLQTLLQDANYAKNIAASLNQLNNVPDLEGKLSNVLKGVKKPDMESTAKGAFESTMKVLDGSNFESFEKAVEEQQAVTLKEWGVDIFNSDPANWDTAVMSTAVKSGSNPVGTFFTQDFVRKYNSIIESSFLAQMELDAHRVRLASELFKQKTGSYPKTGEDVSDSFGRRGLRDRLTGEPYSIDFEKWMLHTTLKEADEKFIFINQMIRTGADI